MTSASTVPMRCSTSATLSDTLAPPRRATSGRCGRFEDPPERLQLPLHEQAGGGRLQVPRDGRDRGVRPVGSGERVVDVAVRELGQLSREAVVVLFLLRMEAEVLQQQHLPGLQRLRLLARLARPRSPAPAAPDARAARPARRPPAAGSTSDRRRPSGGRGARRGRPRRRAPRACRSVGTTARRRVSSETFAALQGRVEVGADEHALARQRQLLDRELRQLTASCR